MLPTHLNENYLLASGLCGRKNLHWDNITQIKITFLDTVNVLQVQNLHGLKNHNKKVILALTCSSGDVSTVLQTLLLWSMRKILFGPQGIFSVTVLQVATLTNWRHPNQLLKSNLNPIQSSLLVVKKIKKCYIVLTLRWERGFPVK